MILSIEISIKIRKKHVYKMFKLESPKYIRFEILNTVSRSSTYTNNYYNYCNSIQYSMCITVLVL